MFRTALMYITPVDLSFSYLLSAVEASLNIKKDQVYPNKKYCPAKKEGGREGYYLNRYDFPFNGRCFLGTLAKWTVAQRHNTLLSFWQRMSRKNRKQVF